jgi:hypothetical protein
VSTRTTATALIACLITALVVGAAGFVVNAQSRSGLRSDFRAEKHALAVSAHNELVRHDQVAAAERTAAIQATKLSMKKRMKRALAKAAKAAQKKADEARQQGYTNGSRDGYNNGSANGYRDGSQDGYNDGLTDGSDDLTCSDDPDVTWLPYCE